MSSPESTDSNQYPGSRYAWFMVIMLTVAYIFSFIDRYILGLLAESIKADLELTDTQMGLLMGPAFGVVYATMGLPIGWLADRKRRTWIVAAGIGLWSFATAATGFAKSFFHVFIARMGVGVGEAALNPCTMSMISDSFAPGRRGKPVAFYTSALSLGAGIASLITAFVLGWAKSVLEISLPLVGVVAPWQFIFIIMGVPGIFLAFVFLFLKEPPRNKSESRKNALEKSGIADMLVYVFKHPVPFFGIIVLQSTMIIIAYSQGWLPSTFERTWGWSPERYSFVNAIVLLVVGPATVNYSGWLSDRFYQKGIRNIPYLLMFLGVAITVVSMVLATLMPNGVAAFVFMAINTFGIAMASAVGPVALINITPSQFRAQTIALYYMIASLAGLMFGPLTVSLLSDNVFGNEHLNYAVSTTAFIFGIPALLFGFYAKRAYNTELDSMS